MLPLVLEANEVAKLDAIYAHTLQQTDTRGV